MMNSSIGVVVSCMYLYKILLLSMDSAFGVSIISISMGLFV